MQNVEVRSLADGVGDALARLAERTMRLQLTVQDGAAWVATASADPVELQWTVLKTRGTA